MRLFSLIFIIVLSLSLTKVYARDKGHSAFLQKSAVLVGAKMALSDGITSDALNVVERQLFVDLRYARNGHTDIEGAPLWEYELSVKVYPAGDPGSFTTHNLKIKYGAEDDYIYNSSAIISGVDIGSQVVEVISIDARYSINGGSSYTSLSGNLASANSNIPDDIFVVFRLESQHYSYLAPGTIGSIYYDPTSQEVRWRADENAEEYDVEWVFIDSADAQYATIVGGSFADPFEYKQPSRIRSTATTFFLPPVYPAGMLFFRMRPVGRYITGVNGDFSHIKTGSWGYEKGPGNGILAAHQISGGFEKNKIWQYQVSYAENGKNKRLISYYDPTYRKRQVASSINSSDVTLIAETKYDFEGRPAVSILPAPVPGFDLAYRSNFNVANATLDSYEKEFFDKNAPAAMYSPSSGTHGAAQYYSINNSQVDDPYRELIPVSTFPFTQTEYVDDNTGRVRSSTGVGKDHKLASGHDTKFFYGTPSPTELHRLFGSNVGKASAYKKNLVLDPNRQGSVSYLDDQGRTIATALIGDAPANLNSIAPPGETITVDLTGNNNYDTAKGEINIVHRFTNLKNTNYSFNYQFSAAHYPLTVNDPAGTGTTSICLECDYELEITITDPQGNWVDLTQATSTTKKITATYKGSDLSCATSGNTTQPAVSFTTNFPLIGEYILSKKVKVILNEDAIDTKVQSTMTSLGIDLNTMINTYVSDVDTTLCDFTCEDHCLTRVLKANPGWKVGVNDVQINEAVENCKEDWCLAYVDSSMNYVNASGQSTECQALYDQMVSHVSPGGWYYESNSLGENRSGFWIFMDAEQVSGSFLMPDGTTVASQTQIRDPQLWNSEWADVAVQFHREYCHYELCIKFQGSKSYDMMMATRSDWVDAGGYANPLATPDKDPVLTVSVSLTNAISFYGGSFGPGNVLMGDMIQYAFNNFNSSQTLTQFVNDQNSGLYDVNVPYNNTNKYAAFIALYQGIKKDLIRVIKEGNGCNCFDDGNEIMKCQQDLKDPAVRNQVTQQGNSFFGDGCEDLCRVNVYTWLEKLNETSNGDLFASPDDSTLAYNTLYDFCMNNPSGCSLANPFGLISNTIAGSTNFSNVATVFSGMGLSLDSIITPDPYTSCDSVVYTYRTHADVAHFIDYLNNEYIPHVDTATSNLPIYVDSAIYPVVYNNGIYRSFPRLGMMQDNFIGFNADNCQLYFVVDSAGLTNLINPARQIDQFYFPYYSATSPFPTTLNNGHFYNDQLGISNIYFLNLRMKILSGGKLVDAYCYSADPYGASNFCFSPLLVEDTICVSQVDTSYYPQTPIFDFNQRKVDCINFLKQQATYNAKQQYQRYRDSIKDQIIAGYRVKCLNGASEVFSATYQIREYHYTLYYYDLANNLVQTVPPEGVDILTSTAFDANGVYNGTSEPDHRLASRYAYNSLNQVIWQVTPDGGGTDFYYNKAGQLRFSQNSKQKSNDDFSYTKYDDQGRIIEVGETHETVPTNITDNINDNTYPTKGWQVTRTFYDEMEFIASSAEFEEGSQQNLRSRVASTIYIQGTSSNSTLPLDEKKKTATHYSYDTHGNVKELVQESSIFDHVAPFKSATRYRYDLISGNVLEVNYQKSKFDEFNHRYRYDGDNRLLTVETSKDGFLWDTDARYHYYLHGPLARVEVGEDYVQSLDYAYTLHGWLKSINASSGRPDLDPGLDGWKTTSNFNKYNARDIYGIALGYYDYMGWNPMDYNSIGGNSHLMYIGITEIHPSLTGGKKYQLYNGNIGHLTYSLPETGYDNWMPTIFKGFNYDQLNRINSMRVSLDDASGSAKSINVISASLVQDYATDYTYDANGNLLSLDRNGHSGQSLDMDELDYVYATDGNGDILNNRLRQVQDNSGYSSNYDTDIDWYATFTQGTTTTSDAYQYDALGNLIADKSEGIASIEWNIQGKIRKITRVAGSTKPDLEFYYGPDGNRVAKIEKPKNASGALLNAKNWLVTQYVRDASGNVMSTYNQTFALVPESGNVYTSTFSQQEMPIFGSSRLGMKQGNSSNTSYFTAVPTTAGWAESVAQVTAPVNVGAVQLIPTNGTTITLAPVSGDAVVTLQAIGSPVRIPSTGYTVVSGSLVQVGEEADLMPGNEVTISTFNPVSMDFSGLVGISSNVSLNLSSASFIQSMELTTTATEFYSERVLEEKLYEYTDHLGNVLATTTDRKTGFTTQDTTVLITEDFADPGNDWIAGEGSEIGSDSPALQVYSQSENTEVMKFFEITPGQGCIHEICLDVSLPERDEIRLTLIIQNSEKNALYTLEMESDTRNCFGNLILPADFILVIQASDPGIYEIDNITIEEHCESFDYYLADVVSAQDYYPFGSTMPGRVFNSGDYRYGFNGMESDDEIKGNGNSYTTEFRQYDPRLGRWLSLDPLMAKYPHQSPYAAYNNNPIYFIDPKGLEGDPPKSHTIASGETLSGIAEEYGTSIDMLAVLNNIENPDKIYAGDNLILPEVFSGAQKSAEPNSGGRNISAIPLRGHHAGNVKSQKGGTSFNITQLQAQGSFIAGAEASVNQVTISEGANNLYAGYSFSYFSLNPVFGGAGASGGGFFGGGVFNDLGPWDNPQTVMMNSNATSAGGGLLFLGGNMEMSNEYWFQTYGVSFGASVKGMAGSNSSMIPSDLPTVSPNGYNRVIAPIQVPNYADSLRNALRNRGDSISDYFLNQNGL